MTLPPVFSEYREPRRLVGWFITAILVLFTFGSALYYYISLGSTDQTEARSCDDALRVAVSAPSSKQKREWRVFDYRLSKLKRESPKRYALFSAVSSFERTGKVDPADLKSLRISSDKRRQAIFDIYTKKIDKAALDRVDEVLAPSAFVYILATIHAHERSGDKAYRANHMPHKAERNVVKTKVVGIAYLMVFALGLGLLGVYLAIRSAGQLKPLGHPFGSIGLFDADRLVMRSAQILLIFFASSMLPAVLGSLDKVWQSIAEVAIIVACVLLLAQSNLWAERSLMQILVSVARRHFFISDGVLQGQ